MSTSNRKNNNWQNAVRRRRLSLHISTIRKSKGLTVPEVAEKAGYEPSMIRKLENGSILPAPGKDEELAQALGVSLDQLWGRKTFKEFWGGGQPKLSESERTGLTLFAPIIKVLSPEKRIRLVEFALTLLEAQGVVPDWEKYESK